MKISTFLKTIFYTLSTRFKFQSKVLKLALLAFIFTGFYSIAIAQTKDSSNLEIKLKSKYYFSHNKNQKIVDLENKKKRSRVNLEYPRNYLIQFRELPDTDIQNKIKNQGIILLQYIPHNAYYASIPKSIDDEAIKELKIKSIQDINPFFKIDTTLFSSNLPTHIEKEKGKLDVQITPFKNYPFSTMLEDLKNLNIPISKNVENLNYVEVRISLEQILAVAAINGISYIAALPEPYKLHNYREANYHKINVLRSQFGTSNNLEGKGITVGVGDEFSGQIHKDLQNRVTKAGYVSNNKWHGDHTSGIIAGNGNVDEKQKGIAPKSLLVFDYMSEIIFKSKKYYLENDVRITSNSYGSDSPGSRTGEYSNSSVFIDHQASGDYQDLLHILSAGNSGSNYYSIGSGLQSAKNSLVVGSVYPNKELSSYSSRGPLMDGRLKPELVAVGEQVNSTKPDNSYGTMSGTSVTAPAVAGAAVLLYERFKQLNNNQNPNAGLIKAILCNTADDLLNEGPDYSSGFGLLNVRRAVEVLESNRYITSSVLQAKTNTHSISVPPGTKQIKVLLYWQDIDASLSSSENLVNDLDLSVVDNNIIHLPWTLTPSQPDREAVKGEDHLNNIEQVSFSNISSTLNILVNGNVVTAEKQNYFLVYEFIQPEIVVTFPYANEKLEPNENVTLHWDATVQGPFNIHYSLNNGASWNLIKSNHSTDYINWVVPEHASSGVLVKVESGSVLGVSAGPSSILNTPQKVKSVIDSTGLGKISWEAIAGDITYEIFNLKSTDTEPQIIATTKENSLTYSYNLNDIKTLTVKAKNNSGISSNRSLASIEYHYNYPGNVPSLDPGLKYKYYEGVYSKMPDFDSLKPVKTGTATNINNAIIRQRSYYYGIRYESYINITEDDVYKFTLRTFHPMTLKIGNNFSLAYHQNSGGIALTKGKHKIILDYYNNSNDSENDFMEIGTLFSEPRNILSSELFHKRENKQPYISISIPEDNRLRKDNEIILINSNASDPDGFIENVDYYINDSLAGTTSKSPYTISLSGLKPGSYLIHAKAYDNNGGIATSSSLTLKILNSNLNIALGKNSVASTVENNNSLAIYATDGSLDTRWSSEFKDAQWIYTDLEDIRVITDIKIVWEAAMASSYNIQSSNDLISWKDELNVNDNKLLLNNFTGLATHGRYIRISCNTRGTGFGFSIKELEMYEKASTSNPSVKIIYPIENAQVKISSPVVLMAEASDNDGFILKVEYFINGSKIGESSSLPHNLTWTFNQLGQHTLLVKATDNDGNVTTSSAATYNIIVASKNIALMKPITSSSDENFDLNSANAVDGNLSSRWSSIHGSLPQSLIVDLQQGFKVERVSVFWEDAYARNYKIQISNNNINWTDIKVVTGNNNVINDWPALTGLGRYVRIFATDRGTGFGYSIYELQVFGTLVNLNPSIQLITPIDGAIFKSPATIDLKANATDADGSVKNVEFFYGYRSLGIDSIAPYEISLNNISAGSYLYRATATDNKGAISHSIPLGITVIDADISLALNKYTTASSLENFTTTASYATDGNYATRWSSKFSDLQWLVVDLGKLYQLSRIKIIWENAFARDYDIQTSNDNINFKNILQVTSNENLINELTINNEFARYVKILGNKRATGFGYSIYELEVYGNTILETRYAGSEFTYEITGNQVNVFPNPASNKISIDLSNNSTEGVSHLEIRNMLNQVVVDNKIVNEKMKHELDISSLLPGNYFLQLTYGDKIIVKRFTVLR